MECVPPVRGSCKYHPQPSSIALVTQAIRAVNVRGLQVLDPFCGTGTIVCVAADNGALKSLGSDIEDYTFCSRDPVYMAATSKGLGEAVIEVHYGIDAFEAISSYQYDIVITDPPNPWAVIGGAPISIKRDTGLNGAALARFWKPRFSDKNLIHGKETTVSAVSNLFAEVLGSGRRVVANLFVSRGRDYKDLLRDEFTFRPVAGTYYEIEMVEE